MGAQPHSWQDARVLVDLVQCKEHGLEALDAPVLVDFATVFAAHSFLVDGEEPPYDQVPLGADLLLAGGAMHSSQAGGQTHQPEPGSKGDRHGVRWHQLGTHVPHVTRCQASRGGQTDPSHRVQGWHSVVMAGGCAAPAEPLVPGKAKGCHGVSRDHPPTQRPS